MCGAKKKGAGVLLQNISLMTHTSNAPFTSALLQQVILTSNSATAGGFDKQLVYLQSLSLRMLSHVKLLHLLQSVML